MRFHLIFLIIFLCFCYQFVVTCGYLLVCSLVFMFYAGDSDGGTASIRHISYIKSLLVNMFHHT